MPWKSLCFYWPVAISEMVEMIMVVVVKKKMMKMILLKRWWRGG